MIAARNLKIPTYILTLISLAMYYTGSVNWMEVYKNIC